MTSTSRLAAIGLLLAAASARAEAPASAPLRSPTTVTFSALPVGEISRPPPRNKLRRPSGTRAEGFVIKREHKSYISVSGHVQGPPSEPQPIAAACLRTSTDQFRFRGPDESTAAPEWAPQAESVSNLSPQQTPLAVVHREEVVIAGDRATLETRDAVVDVGTLASKTIDQRSLPLAKVGDLIGGVQVFALRKAAGVELVVVAPEHLLLPSSTMMAHVSGNPQIFTASQCRHLRIGAPVAKGEGTAATVLFRVLDTDPKAPPPVDDGSGTVVRTQRTLAVHVSTSWVSSDAEPVISATAGWQGPSEKLRMPLAMHF